MKNKELTLEKFIVVSCSGQNEFDLHVSKANGITLYCIYANNTSVWAEHIKNTLLLSMTDNGNGIEFNKIKNLDYADAALMKILLRFADFYEGYSKIEYRVIKQITLLEI
jgi:lactate dehydrogenase-like 2-hydroxyacid dehydrogenase